MENDSEPANARPSAPVPASSSRGSSHRHQLYAATIRHPCNEVSITFGMDRIRFAKLIADNGPEILDTWDGQLAAVCDRELRDREIPFGTIWRTTVLDVGEFDTFRGLEHVHDISVVGNFGTAKVRLQVQEDEYEFHMFLGEEQWADLVWNLLTFEVDHDDVDVDVADGGATLDVSITIGSSTWVYFELAKDLGAIADAVVSAASDAGDGEIDDGPVDAAPASPGPFGIGLADLFEDLAGMEKKRYPASEIEAKQSLEDAKPWRTVLQEYLDDTCDWSGVVEVGPLAAFKKAVPPSVVREHILRYEGEEMGAYGELVDAVRRLEAEGNRGEALDHLRLRRDAHKRRMDSDGYDFGRYDADRGSGKIYPPSTVASEDPVQTQKVQSAYDIAMAIEHGGDPGFDLLRQRFIEAFGDDSTDAI